MKPFHADHRLPNTSVGSTPILCTAYLRLYITALDFFRAPQVAAMAADSLWATPPVYATEPSQAPLLDAAVAASAGDTENDWADLSWGAVAASPSTVTGPACTRKTPLRIRFKRIKRPSKTTCGTDVLLGRRGRKLHSAAG